MITLQDLITTQYTDEMRAKALSDKNYYAQQHGKKTKDYEPDRDYNSSLVQQAVEQLFEKEGVDFEAHRRKPIGQGDKYDLKCFGHTIDIKSTKGVLNVKHPQEREFKIFQFQIDRGLLENKTHFIFGEVSRRYLDHAELLRTHGRIFGVISKEDFFANCYTKYDWVDQFVQAKHFTPILEYIKSNGQTINTSRQD